MLVMLNHLHTNALSHFTHLLDRILSSTTFPSSWKIVLITPILQPHKDTFLPQSYRPISLLSSWSKILEKILNKRLSWYLESNNILSESQYGCRKNKSSLMALADLDAMINETNSSKASLYSVFFDIENVFPRVYTHHIISMLHQAGLRGPLPIFI